ncbi:hypothetical protein ACFXPA_37430 [Amycolatopsis sp. NPDC059090]
MDARVWEWRWSVGHPASYLPSRAAIAVLAGIAAHDVHPHR